MSSLDRSLSGEVLAFRLEDETATLEAPDALLRTGRSARTLVKQGPLRVTLIAIAPAGSIAEHHAEGPITVQPLSGEILFRIDGGAVHTLRPGDLLSVGAGVRHSVESRTGGTFLLTAVLPAAAERSGGEDRAGGP